MIVSIKTLIPLLKTHRNWCRSNLGTAVLFWLSYLIILASGTRSLTTEKLLHSDFDAFRHASVNLINNKDFYQDTTRPSDGGPPHRRYVYYPLLAIFLAPILLFNLKIGFVIWWLLNAVLIAWIVYLIRELIKSVKPTRRILNLATWLPLLACSGYFRVNLNQGNINFFVVATVLWAIRFYLHRDLFWSGFVFGFATVLKVTPGLFLIYLLLKREWKAVGAFMIAGALFSQGIGTLAFGWNKSFDVHILHTKRLLGAADTKTWWMDEFRTSHINQSLAAAIRRFTSPVSTGFGYQGKQAVNVVQWPEERIQNVTRSLSISIILLTLFSILLPCKERRPEIILVEFAMLAITILMVTSVTWNAHYVMMILPFAVALCLPKTHLGSGKQKVMMQILVFTALLLTFSTRRFLLGKEFSNLARALSASFFSAFILWFGFLGIRCWLFFRGEKKGRKKHLQQNQSLV